ncbi:MAG TPA: right-handed parallel beta-helix repeat-containing protein [Rugosimonospora sp.]|nr:right-handed parallel beta-helix repeat-containing protein [Rugosimonospora sp.]
MPPKVYGTGVPLVVPPGKTLLGLRSDLMTVSGLYEPNAQIKPLATFTGVAAIRFLDQTDGGYATISGEQRVLNVTIDGSNIASGADGIQAKGNIQNVALRDVTIRRFPNSGIYCGLQGGVAPYSWRLHRVMLDNNHAHGMFGERMVDLTAVDCQAIGNWSNGWMLQNAANSQMVGCRAEWNGNHGFYLSGDWGNGAGSGGMLLSGCSTDRNGFNGVYLDCTGTPPIVISNLMTRRDGRNGGTGGGNYAGLAANGATTPIIVGDWTNFPGVDDGGASTNSPDYGASFTNTTYVQMDNAYLHAAVGAIRDGGGNGEIRLGSNITYATGTTSTFTRGRVPSGEITVAASDSASTDEADFLCTGTNDHLVIQQAIDLVNGAAGKGRVRLLDGTFNLGATINWPSGTGLGLVGSGWGTVLKLAAGVNDYAINFSAADTRSTFSDFTIDGNLANQTAGPTGGIWADGAVECVFQRIHFTSCGSTGLVLAGMTGGAFGHNNVVTHCLFDNANTSTFEGNGIYLTSSDENFIIACDFQFLGGSGAAMGMIHDTAGTQTILGCNFVNGGNSRPGIRVQDASATKIVACNFDGVAGDAIFLAAQKCIVESNTIFGIGATGTSGAYTGVHLEFAATQNIVSGNSIASHTVNGSAHSLIREESVGSSGNNLIAGNVLITNGTLAVAALDINAPGTMARDNMGGGVKGDVAPALRTNAGAITDSVFAPITPSDGMLGLDTTNKRLYARSGGSWIYAPLDNGGANFTPSDHAMLLWTADPGVISGSGFQLAFGRVYLSKIKVTAPVTVSNMHYHVETGGTSLTAGQCLVGLYDSSGTQVAVSSDQATAMASSGAKTAAFTASAALSVGYYYAAFLANGTGTVPNVSGASGNSGVASNNLSTATSRSLNTGTGNTALPASITLGSQSVNIAIRWAGLS